jgi:hypothetical protein
MTDQPEAALDLATLLEAAASTTWTAWINARAATDTTWTAYLNGGREHHDLTAWMKSREITGLAHTAYAHLARAYHNTTGQQLPAPTTQQAGAG